MNSTQVSIALRKVVDAVKAKFHEEATIELFTDGSGYIRDRFTSDIEFAGIGEFIELLELE